MAKVSVADVPVTPYETDAGSIYRDDAGSNNPDKLGTGQYAKALAKFAIECDTPLTIGVQGEWGSGKTSLLNMMREDIYHEEVSRGTKGARTKLAGSEAYSVIWINTWEHSLLKNPEGCLISIIEEIIEHISQVDGQIHTAQRAKNALAALAKGAVKVGAGMTMGLKGAEVAEDLMSSSNTNVVKDLRGVLQGIVSNVVDRKQNPVKRFVIFIDDLDRLEPAVAVQVLELLKNIFNLQNCVFVLAIDYQVVVKGLADKFGKPNPENEWEFRAFFDKIIQLPFMMPMGKYDLSNYITGMLVSDIGYFPGKASSAAYGAEDLASLVRLTLGHNPRSMKRLLNSLSLIKLTEEMKSESSKSDKNLFAQDQDLSLRKLVFALVCFQISYPKVYELLLINPDFENWDDEFVNKVTGGPHEDNKELNEALKRVEQVHKEQFDDDWEKALFKIVWLKKWQRSRLAETSKALGLICERMLPAPTESDEKRKLVLEQALKMTAVTAVSSTDDTVLSSGNTGGGDDIQGRLAYWRKFSSKMKGSGTVFDTDVTPIRGTHSSGILKRKADEVLDEPVLFSFTTSSSSPLKVESYAGSETVSLFEFWRDNKEKIEKAIGATIKFRIEAERQELAVAQPSEVKGRIPLDKVGNETVRDSVFDWYSGKLRPLEEVLRDLSQPSSDVDQLD